MMFRLTRLKRRLARLIENKNGSTLVYAMVIMFIMALLGGAIANKIVFQSRDAYEQVHRTQALYLAEAGITRAQKEFKDGATDLDAILRGTDGTPDTGDDGLLSFGSNVSLGNGAYSVVVTDNDDGDNDLYTDVDQIVRVTSNVSVLGEQMPKTVKAYMEVIPAGYPANVRGVIVAAGPVETKGAIKIDGRDHDIDGNLIPNSGSFGISTAQTFDQKGNSKVGGTNAGVDFPPSKPGNPAVIEENADWTAEGGFPDTPDKVMGVPPGTLKAIAQSGVNGSQYTTDPSTLSFPLSGVTYVELPSGGKWQSVHFGSSSGILVVHNTATNAIMKNLNTGTFRGIIIADDIIHIHTTIIGAVVSLIPGPSAGNCIGNGSGDVLYSVQSISTATQSAVGPVVTMKSWYY